MDCAEPQGKGWKEKRDRTECPGTFEILRNKIQKIEAKERQIGSPYQGSTLLIYSDS